MAWPIFEQLKCGAILKFKFTLNCGPHFSRGQKWCKVFEMPRMGKELAMPSLGLRGAHMQIEKFYKHPSLAILFEFKSNSNEFKIQWHSRSSHVVTSPIIMPSLEVIGQSKITS